MQQVIENGILNEYLDILNKQGDGRVSNEFELRFGKFIYDKFTKKNVFESSVEIDFFYNLKKMLIKHNVKNELIETVEFSYDNPNGRGSIRKIQQKGKDDIYLLKNSYKKYNVYDYDIRMSMASERIISLGSIRDVNFSNPQFSREKKRYRFHMHIGFIDLTIVNDSNNKTKYEIELEIAKGVSTESINEFVNVMLQTRQQNKYVMSSREKRDIYNLYRDITGGSTFFVGVQPENLKREDISLLYKDLYSVTDKADGDRYFLFIDNNKNVYFLDNNLNNFIKTDLKSDIYNSTIIDGELLRKDDKYMFYAFDLIAYNGKDLRGDDRYLLKQRLDRLNDIMATIKSSDNYIISMKKFIYRNVFLGGSIIMDDIHNKPYENDGLIFTPMNEAYPKNKKWTRLFKWKPSSMNTIDFYCIKEGDEWELYVQHPDVIENVKSIKRNKERFENALVLFDINKVCDVKTELVTFKMKFDENEFKDPITGEPFMSKTVIECKFDTDRKQFVPIRTRWDKTVNPKKHGNYSAVACDIWNNIENPITPEFLFNFNNSTSPNGEDVFFFERMRSFHNKIKEFLYDKYVNNCEYLLELCSGKGGDMYKWYHNNVKNVHCYDINQGSIKEALKRKAGLESKYNTSVNYIFTQLDLQARSIPKLDDIIWSPSGDLFYDNVVCHFGIHYFFKNENCIRYIISQICNNIKAGGHFICTFIDNNQFAELNEKMYIKDNYIHYNISQVGDNQVKIFMNGGNYMSNAPLEWIIDFDLFKTYMKEYGFVLVETQLFKDLYQSNVFKMEEYEQNISFLYRYAVWVKDDNIGSALKTMTFNNYLSSNTESKIDYINDIGENIMEYEKYDIQLLRIKSNKNVAEILNLKSVNYNVYECSGALYNEHNIHDYIKDITTDYKVIGDEFKIIGDGNTSNNTNVLLLYYHKHTVDKGDNCEQLVYHNWYIITKSYKLYLDKADEDYVKSCFIELGLLSDGIVPEIPDYTKMTIKELQQILKARGIKTSGKKAELIERIKSCV